jgi:tetratricopeptide (TPR) repeat protein
LAALAAARPTIARLDANRHPEEVAADLIEAWTSIETALRSLVGGSVLSGQPLIRELRGREIISLDQAHALLEFLAVRERVQRTDYRPRTDDITVAREAFSKLEQGLTEMDTPVASPPVSATTPIADATAAAGAPPPIAADPRRRKLLLFGGIAAVLLLAVVAALLLLDPFGLTAATRIERGRELFAAGRAADAQREFSEAARKDPDDPIPHVYLGRIAREERDWGTAARELQRAAELEANNPLVQRELGALFFARGQYDAARRRYVEAIRLDNSDRVSMGYLGCSLVRLGRVQEGMSWISRAGQGDWTRCLPPMQPMVPGGAAVPQP